MNVALTRAKCLMILVCNPKTLQEDPLWYEFVKYCKENNACAGKRFELINHGEDNNADNTEDINGTSDDEILKFLKQVE